MVRLQPVFMVQGLVRDGCPVPIELLFFEYFTSSAAIRRLLWSPAIIGILCIHSTTFYRLYFVGWDVVSFY